MPQLLPNVIFYQINYENLFKEIHKFCSDKIFDNCRTSQRYVSTFLELLEISDVDLQKSLKNPEMKKKVINYYRQTEVFQLPYYFKSSTVYIHFRITEILNYLECIEFDKEQVIRISVSEFTKTQSKFLWSPPDFPFISNKLSEPILLVPFVHNYHNWVVIDGNNRLSNLLNGKSKIPTIILDPNDLLKFNLFSSDFDKYLYALLCDLHILVESKHKFDLLDKELFDKSFLSTLKLDFTGILL